MWIKICANTNLDDTQLAVDLGADAVGFVFAPSPRQVTPQQVRAITSGLQLHGRNVERIGVFRGSSFEEIRDAVAVADLTGAQIHETPRPSLIAALHKEFHGSVRLVQTLHWRVDSSPRINATTLAGQVDALSRSGYIDRILIDTQAGSALGGTGLRFDWDGAGTVFRSAQQVSVILAGGLTPENVKEAIRKLSPWGIDVASGVERSAGLKHSQRLASFIQQARAAE